MLKIRGSEIQQDLGELLMECAGPYALPYSPRVRSRMSTGREAPGGARAATDSRRSTSTCARSSIYGGTNEVQKNLIARAVLGL